MRSRRRGFSLIELLIATAIGLVAISCIVLVADSLIRGELHSELVARASGLLEKEQSLAASDFEGIEPSSQAAGAYTDSVLVEQLSDYVTKLVKVRAEFSTAYGAMSSELETLVTDTENRLSPETCSSVLEGDWDHPVMASYPLMPLISTSTGPYSISDVDAYKGRLYLTADRRAYKTDPALFVFDISGGAPALLGRLPSVFAATQGLTAVEIAEDAGGAGRHAFASSKTTSQFQTIDVTDPALPALSGSKAVSGGEGNTVDFRDQYVYLGLAAQPGSPELYVMDVHDPAHPSIAGKWPPSGSIGSGINAIRTRAGYAFLAHGATAAYSEQLSVLDVSTPASPYHVSGYLAPPASAFPNSGNGKSVALFSRRLFLGRTASNKVGVPQFVFLEASAPASLPASASGSSVLTPDSSVNRLIVRGHLVFALTNQALVVLDIADPANIVVRATLSLPSTGGTAAPSMDCEGNTLYIASNDAANIGTISVVVPG